MDDKYLEIMNSFGVQNQLKKLNEECFEFIESVYNYENEYNNKLEGRIYDLKSCKEDMIEEMADMFVLLHQFVVKYKINSKDLYDAMAYKLNRTLDRLKTGFYDKD